MIRVEVRPLVDPHEALVRALKSLTEGSFDYRSIDGAQANALEAIAWSLAGLLAERIEAAPVRPARPHSDATLTHELRARGFVPVTP
jgi:hypothetical protein